MLEKIIIILLGAVKQHVRFINSKNEYKEDYLIILPKNESKWLLIN